jgi:SAM-dependent methyltransferase
MPKDRGIESLGQDRFSNLLELMEDKIARKGKIRVLDAGCGYGVTMMGLLKRFGEKIEIMGFNYNQKSGTVKIMKEQAIKKGIFDKKEIQDKSLPKIVYLDASKTWPFKSKSFDFVYGQASLYLFDDKIHALEESNRILKKDGLARFNSVVWDNHLNKELRNPRLSEAWEIWDKGKLIAPENYFKRIKGVKIGYIDGKPRYVEISGGKKISFGLKFITSIDYNFLWDKFGGVKSIYTTQMNFDPRYK